MTTNGTEERPLPDGWTTTTVNDVYVEIKNGVAGRQNKDGVGFPVTRIQTISNGVIDLSKVGYLENIDEEKIQKYRLVNGDILFSNINSDFHLGKTALFELGKTELYHGMNLLLIRLDREAILPRYVHYLFNYYRQNGFFISIAQHAVNQSSINQTKLRNVEIPLAPLSEQERIVAEIEKQFTRLDQAVASLRRLQGSLARYKASILKAACEGRLVPQDPNDEPAADLLARILAERRAQWQAANPGKKYQEVSGVETAVLPDLPEGWVGASVDSILREPLRNGHSAKATNDPDGIRTLTLTAVTKGDFSEGNTKITSAEPTLVKDMWLEPGDILIERSNTPELVGTTRLYKGPSNFAIFPDLIIRARPSKMLSDRYIEIAIRSHRSHTYFKQSAQGISGTMPKISQGTIRNLVIPIPPLAEQERIVAEVERRLSVVTATEQAITANLSRAERLRQSILHRAFTGQLV